MERGSRWWREEPPKRDDAMIRTAGEGKMEWELFMGNWERRCEGVEELERADGGEVASLWVVGWALRGYVFERDFLYFMISILVENSLSDPMRKTIGD